jgi:hypothetical protein
MFAKCANPECGKPFDYTEGQLVRCCRSSLTNPGSADKNRVEHFWLCGSCSVLYVLSQESGKILIKPRVEESRPGKVRSFAAVA